MRRSRCRYLAIASLLLAAAALMAVTRPRYGGTLRVQIQAELSSLEPAEWPAKSRLAALVFEPLVRLDEAGRPQPALAVSWKSDASGRRWEFLLRPDVKFHDGSPLTPAAVVAALAPARENWQWRASGSSVVVRAPAPAPELLRELAGPGLAVALKKADGTVQGTGPFRIATWEPFRRATLAANENHWQGRPFLDTVAIEMSQSSREALLAVELGRADIAELEAGEILRDPRETRAWSSEALELLALAFVPGRPAAEDPRVREALGLSIEREAIHSVLLQGRGLPAGGLLPQWLSGYAFLFPAARDLPRARRIAVALPASLKSLIVAVDGSDSLSRTIAERVAVNASEAGIKLRVSAPVGPADLRIVRVRLESTDPERALSRLAAALSLPGFLQPLRTLESVYTAERTIVEGGRVIPLFHLPDLYAVSPRVRTWNTPGLSRDGSLRLDDVWLEPEKP